jgi:adenylate cyclase
VSGDAASALRFREEEPDGSAPSFLVLEGAPGGLRRFPVYRRLEIARDDPGRLEEPGVLLVADSTISRRHCVVSRRGNGRCFVVDMSRNGTRLDGRRLVPNAEVELHPGHRITVGENLTLVLEGEAHPGAGSDSLAGDLTVPRTGRSVATVLVGDIRDYTVLVRTALSEELQRSVGRVFEAIAAAVVELGGSVKEAQGDAILAYWEGGFDGKQALQACRAALALDALALRLAGDRSAWSLPDAPLHMDWALSTGFVLIDSLGRKGAMGLSMMGEPVVRAFRIEKYATDETGRIVACSATRELAAAGFTFRDLGEQVAKGFDRPDRVYALAGER